MIKESKQLSDSGIYNVLFSCKYSLPSICTITDAVRPLCISSMNQLFFSFLLVFYNVFVSILLWFSLFIKTVSTWFELMWIFGYSLIGFWFVHDLLMNCTHSNPILTIIWFRFNGGCVIHTHFKHYHYFIRFLFIWVKCLVPGAW